MKSIFVYAGWLELCPLIGEYRYDRASGVVMFSYSDAWRSSYNIQIDPQLSLTSGWQYLSHPGTDGTFGFMEDTSPDRWGRGLLARKERFRAGEEKRRPRTLMAEDFVLGVSDEGRSGGLRFKENPDGEFLSGDKEIPKLTAIRSLEHSARMFEDPEERMNEKWLKDLLSPGSSLGGARPKSNVRDLDHSLWIAKFPSRNDDVDIGAWEMTVHDLAVLCGINVPDAKVMALSSYGHTFLSKRFDRDSANKRFHYMSAMTALGLNDHSAPESGKGFLDIAEFIAEKSDQPEEDLKELFRRVAFSASVSNTDCHFRNHAFLLHDGSWRLSPAYDLNPNLEKSTLAIPITDTEADLDLRLVLDTAEFYRLRKEEAKAIIEKIHVVVLENWRTIASKYGISPSEQEYMAPAFMPDGV